MTTGIQFLCSKLTNLQRRGANVAAEGIKATPDTPNYPETHSCKFKKVNLIHVLYAKIL
jgi:hypothetical protein